MNRPGCFDPTAKYKPQWAYATPDGFRDELFLYPFSFTVKADGKTPAIGLPMQLEDDVPTILRAILFPNCSPNPSSTDFPAFVRITDSNGNPLSDGLILAAGVYGLSGLENQNAFGFPFEPEILCAPGGTILFDFLLQSNGGVSQHEFGFALGGLNFFATIMGAAGNGLTIQLIDPGAPNVPLSVALVGGIHVQVTLATNGASAITSTVGQVAAIVNGTPAIAAVMQVIPELDTTQVVTAEAQTALTGGSDGGNVTLNGTLIGVKRFPNCL
jgi:hypothetical protein